VAVKRLKRKKTESERSTKAVILTKVGVLTISFKVVAVKAFMMTFCTVCFSGKFGKGKSKWTPEVMQEEVWIGVVMYIELERRLRRSYTVRCESEDREERERESEFMER
jgi:hypothetical protein